MTDPKSKFYQENIFGQNPNGTTNRTKQSPAYTIEVFEDIGRAFCAGLLDYYEINPVTRLPLSVWKNIDGVKLDLLNHNPIFIAKTR